MMRACVVSIVLVMTIVVVSVAVSAGENGIAQPRHFNGRAGLRSLTNVIRLSIFVTVAS